MVPRELCQRIEEAALNSWPALQQLLYDGWVLRFADGYTKRANSVSVVYPSRGDPAAKIARCEALYRARGLPPIFRLTPLSPPEELDPLLQERGYTVLEPSRVLWLDLADPMRYPLDDEGRMQAHRLEDWLTLYGRLSGTVRASDAHAAILRAMVPERIHAAWHDARGRGVSCALGVLEGDCLGLFDLVTAAGERRRGYATRLVCAMLEWARERGGRLAYLQVPEANAAAQELYRRIGFADAYTYWYRVPGPPGETAGGS